MYQEDEIDKKLFLAIYMIKYILIKKKLNSLLIIYIKAIDFIFLSKKINFRIILSSHYYLKGNVQITYPTF